MKLLTVTVPCYNSESYMERCVQSLLPGGDALEIILIDDGSTDGTAAIADRYAAEHPEIVRVIHQENGGHGEGINQGLKHAQGTYFKVVDSDDRLDMAALGHLLRELAALAERGEETDLIVNDYVYDRAEKNAVFSVNYRSVMRPGVVTRWEDIRRFPPHKQFMIHSLIYRTQMLRDMGLSLPRHTFYEDNIYIYRPLPFCKRVYYFHEPLYGYFIGRGDQSINDQVILRRLPQVTDMARQMITSYTLAELERLPDTLCRYMLSNCAGQLSTTCSLQFIANTEESLAMNRSMWEAIRTFDEPLYRRLRRTAVGRMTVLPGRFGRGVLVFGYRLVRRVIRF